MKELNRVGVSVPPGEARLVSTAPERPALRRNVQCYAFLVETMHQERETKRPQPGAGGNVFRLEGEYWTIAYDGAVYRLRDTAGLRYVAYLLQRPGEKVAAVELAPHGRRTLGRLTKTDGAELARVKTTRSITAALHRIGTHNAALIAHLRATIKTGTSCSYTPDPHLPVKWEF